MLSLNLILLLLTIDLMLLPSQSTRFLLGNRSCSVSFGVFLQITSSICFGSISRCKLLSEFLYHKALGILCIEDWPSIQCPHCTN